MKTMSTTGKFELNKAELAASMKRHENGSTDEEVDPIQPDLIGNDADTIHRLITQGIWSGVVRCPGELEILIYPGSVEEPHVCLITVWNAQPAGTAQVVAATAETRELAPREMWDGDDRHGITEDILTTIVSIANSALEKIAAVEKTIKTGSKARS